MANTNARITSDMNNTEIMLIMSDCDINALHSILEMVNADAAMPLMDILMSFDSMGIYGSKIYEFWRDCCDSDIGTLKEILLAFRKGKRPKGEELYYKLRRVTDAFI